MKNSSKKISLIPFRGYGNQEVVIFQGRIVSGEFSFPLSTNLGLFKRISQFLKRYFIKPLPNITVSLKFKEKEIQVTTNKYGMFYAEMPLELNIKEGWHEYDCCLESKPGTKYQGEVWIDAGENTFGIISDIDDTIVISEATNKLKMMMTILSPLSERTPFLGVKEFYKALVEGDSKNPISNPLFFISSSQWNIYDILTEFMRMNDIPKAPLLLKSIKGPFDLWRKTGKHNHKKEKIYKILSLYPDISFVLIGDSGQHDSEIYADVALSHPERIKAIYIRDVTRYKDPLVEEARKKLEGKTEFIVAPTTKEAAIDALKKQLITEENMREIAEAIDNH